LLRGVTQDYVALELIFINLAFLKLDNPNSLILMTKVCRQTKEKVNSGWHEEVTVKFLKVFITQHLQRFM